LRSLATAEVETAPASTAKTHNATFFIYLSLKTLLNCRALSFRATSVSKSLCGSQKDSELL
jgi:hypothetical protein